MGFLFLTRSEDAASATASIFHVILAGIAGLIAGIIAVFILQGVVRYLLRRSPSLFANIRPAAHPLQLALGILGAWLAVYVVVRAERPDWHANALHGFVILEIVAATWLIATLVGAAERIILDSVRENSQSRYRKVQTQLQILQRVITVVIWICGFAAILLTFPVARTLGTSMLASAGIVSVVVGVAAQSTLSNVFAGLQLAFSDSIRVGDVVFWENERCAVEEITLTYVVLRVWDGRRLIVPSSKMTTTTFENWTRRSSELIDHVDFRLDWSAPIDEIREYLNRLLKDTDLWDGRLGVLQVRDADGEYIQVSALVSAKNSSTMIDLRNYLREEMISWLQNTHPEALPHVRYFNYNFEETERPGGRNRTVRDEGSPFSASADKNGKSEEATGTATTKSSANNPDVQATVILPRDLSKKSVNQPERVSIAQRDVPEVGEMSTRRDNAEQAENASAVRRQHDSSIFTGSIEAEARAHDFESAGAAAAAEREELARRRAQAETDKEEKA